MPNTFWQAPAIRTALSNGPGRPSVGKVPGSVQSIERAAAMLHLLAASSTKLSLAEVAGSLDLAKGTAHGILRTLADIGFVEQDRESGRYRIGAGLLQLGGSYLDENELRARAVNWADTLASRTDETVRIGILQKHEVLIIHHVFRPDDTPQTLDVGSWLPAHATALGKVLLASAPAAVRTLTTLERYTSRTITSRAALESALAQVRERVPRWRWRSGRPGLPDWRRRSAGTAALWSAPSASAARSIGSASPAAWPGRRCSPPSSTPRERSPASWRPTAVNGDNRKHAAHPGVPVAVAPMTEHSERYVLAIDQGTTSTRCIIFDRHGRLVGVRQREHEQHFPRPGWVEHDAVEIWNNVTRIVPAALREAGIGLEQRGRPRGGEPARDDGALGPAHRRADRARDRLAGRAYLRRCWTGWPGTRTSPGSRSCAGCRSSPYFAAPAAALALRPRRRPARSAPRAVTCCSGRWRPGSSGI